MQQSITGAKALLFRELPQDKAFVMVLLSDGQYGSGYVIATYPNKILLDDHHGFVSDWQKCWVLG